MSRSKNSHRGLRKRSRSKCCKWECKPSSHDPKKHCLICCDLVIHFLKQDLVQILKFEWGISLKGGLTNSSQRKSN